MRTDEIDKLEARARDLGDHELLAHIPLVRRALSRRRGQRPTEAERPTEEAARKACSDALWRGYLRRVDDETMAALRAAPSYEDRLAIIAAHDERLRLAEVRRGEMPSAPTGTGFSLGHHED